MIDRIHHMYQLFSKLDYVRSFFYGLGRANDRVSGASQNLKDFLWYLEAGWLGVLKIVSL